MRFDFRRLKAAILCLMLGATTAAQTPTQDQLKIFQSLHSGRQERRQYGYRQRQQVRFEGQQPGFFE
jgi:hypothetical protein